MSQHGLPTWYSWVVLLMTVVSCLGLSVTVSLVTAHRSVEAERRARLAAQQAADRNQLAAQEVADRNQRSARVAACQLIVAQDDAFSDATSKPTTSAGQRSALAWHNLRETFRCDQK